MKSNYQILNEKLEKEVTELFYKVQQQNALIESSGIGVGDGGIDPGYNGSIAASLQNKGYITGLAGGNSDAIVANPPIIDKTAKTLKGEMKPGMFGFDSAPQKPMTANNIGLGMGLALGDQEFAATRDFVRQYSKSYEMDPTQQFDPEDVGYISWKTVNSAVSARENERLQSALQNAGLKAQTVTGYGQALDDTYNLNLYMPKGAKKAVDNATNSIMGKASKSKGKEVNGYVRKLSNPEFNRFSNTWTSNRNFKINK